ncbi:Cyclin-A3-1 [Camellia lanceoleosa]|uniref:Cyclin-A3-1 n=1 Tax=Camellia lanceoleosa TaxID=1840588 RepID=A0ACC0FJB4_9ERIC|nr:Cyclin-A3-1 [Camellia lanceoleosa]
MEDFGNAMIEQHEKEVTHSEEGVSHTTAGALHSGDELTQSPERVPAFTETITHSEENGSHVMSNILGLHMHRTRRSRYLPLHNLKRKVLRAEIGFHCLPRELHIVGKGDHILMSEYCLLFQNPHVARELAKLDILDVAPIHLPLLSTNSSDVCIEEIKEANGLIGDTIYASKNMKLVLSFVSYLVRVVSIWDNGICNNPIMVYNSGREKEETLAQLHGKDIPLDWLVEVAQEYKLVSDTLYLTVSYINRFLSHAVVKIKRDVLNFLNYEVG